LTERFHAPESYTLPAEYATVIYLRLLSCEMLGREAK
jgi:hypothetical protein